MICGNPIGWHLQDAGQLGGSPPARSRLAVCRGATILTVFPTNHGPFFPNHKRGKGKQDGRFNRSSWWSFRAGFDDGGGGRSGGLRGRGQGTGPRAGLRRRPVDRLSLRRRGAEPADRPHGSGDLQPGARRIGHRTRGKAVCLDDSAVAAGHRRIGGQAEGWAACRPDQLGRQGGGDARHQRCFRVGQAALSEERLPDRADRSSRRRHGAEAGRRQNPPDRRQNPRFAAAQESPIRQICPQPARSSPAAGRQRLERRGGVSNPQSAPPGTRICLGLWAGNAAAGREKRRCGTESADRRNQGRRRQRRRADAHLRSADRHPGSRRRGQRHGPVEAPAASRFPTG